MSGRGGDRAIGADAIIRNTYRTLMSRGTKACGVFACDPELNEYLKGAVSGD